MTIGKYVGFHNYCFANYPLDRESATINFWRNPLDHYTTPSIGGLHCFCHSYSRSPLRRR